MKQEEQKYWTCWWKENDEIKKMIESFESELNYVYFYACIHEMLQVRKNLLGEKSKLYKWKQYF